VTDLLELLRTALEGRYTLERLIGQGGMATVYLARDCRHDRPVAIKVLRPELAASIGADRFLREIKVAAQLQHPNILALYDSGEADGFLYYVMPFVEGESLRARLDREEQLSLPESIQLTCEIADALHYAHTHRVIHRDIKPENILLQDGRPLVADFGIARAVSQGGGEKLTETGMAVGTPHYMSPEQAHGGDRVDGRTDQYSLACMLYEMLVGQPPFSGPNAMAILARHSMEAVPSLQIVRNSVPDDVEDAIMRALEKTPADRFPSIREFAEVLAQVDVGPSARRTSSRSMRARGSAPRGVRRTTGAVPASQLPVPARIVAFARAQGVRFWMAAAALFLLAGGLLAWRLWLRPADASAGTPGLSPNRIAVLYLEKAPGSSDSLAYLADGLTEALIHELSGVQGLQVISSNGVRPFKQGEFNLHDIARTLQVGTLVHGSLAQSGQRLRLTVSMANAATGVEIGSKTLERPREEIFALQDDLAKEVSVFLREQLGQEIQLTESRSGTSNPAAWEVLERARAETKLADPLVAAGDSAAAGRQLARADSLLSQAESLDPKWVTPPTLRAWGAYKRARIGGSFDKSYYDEWTTSGLKHAEQALRLKPDDPDALEARGSLRYLRWLLNLSPDPAQSAQLLNSVEKDLRAAVEKNPQQASAWSTLSHLLLTRSQTAEGKLAALRAYEADPYLTTANLTLWRLFESSLDLEDGVESSHWCAEGLRRFPGDVRFVECQIRLFALKDRKPNVDQAWRLLEQYVQLYPPHQREYRRLYGQMLVAMALARAGLADSARALAERSRGNPTIDPARELTYLEVLFRTMVGDRDEAIRLLGTYLATNPQRRGDVARDQSWWIRDLRSDPRFKDLVGQG
jgi:eukaryotic-like serine/threonine-protein kinase